MRVRNVTKNQELGEAIEIADTSSKRRTGLLKHARLPAGCGMWIVPCEAIHTFWMKFAIDAVFLNRKRKVIKLKKDLARFRFAICFRAHSVLELPAGTLAATGTETGDQLEFQR